MRLNQTGAGLLAGLVVLGATDWGRAALADTPRNVAAVWAASDVPGPAAPARRKTAPAQALVAPVAGTCAALPDRQLGRLVRVWPPPQRATAVAVILGESGGRPCAVGDVGLQTRTWGPSVCLFQLRSMPRMAGTGGVRDGAANLRSVSTCIRNAHALWKAEGWRPWSAWLHGTYRRHLDRARKAVR